MTNNGNGININTMKRSMFNNPNPQVALQSKSVNTNLEQLNETANHGSFKINHSSDTRIPKSQPHNLAETNYKKKFLLQQSDFILPSQCIIPFDTTQFQMPGKTTQNTNFKPKASNGFAAASIKTNQQPINVINNSLNITIYQQPGLES